MIHTRAAAAKVLKVHPNTLKRWEAERVIPEADRDSLGRRVYSDDAIEKLKKIAEERREAHEKRLAGE